MSDVIRRRLGVVRRATGVLATMVVVAAPRMWAQDVSVRSYLDRTSVGVNQQFILTLEVSGAQRIDSEPVMPDMNDFSIFLGSGTSQQVQIVNGRTTVSLNFQYRFQATAEGTFDIGAISVGIDGRSYATDPLRVAIGANTTGAQGQRAPSQPGGTATSDVAPEDLFLTVSASRNRVYENEPVVLEYRIYTRVNVSSYSVTQLPTTTGFWTEEYEIPGSPTVENEVRNGVQYATAVIKKMAAFPTGAGTKVIDPLSVEAQVRVRRRSRDPFDDFFGGSSIFGSNVPVLISSEPVTVEVLPLPTEGRPADFTDFVGELSVSTSIDKDSAETNEPVTLTVRLQGSGNLQTLGEPEIDFPPDFEVYPPEVSQRTNRGDAGVTGSRTYEYVLIPRAPGQRSIPPVVLSYFSPLTGSYETARSEAVPIEVTGDAVAGPVVAFRGRGAIEPLREDIRYIRIQPPTFRQAGRSITGNPAFWLTLLAPLAAVGGALGVRRHRDRIQGDVAFARHRRASRVARKRLSHARGLAHPQTQKEFYGEAARALQGFLGDRLNIAEAGMIKEEVERKLHDRGVSDDVVHGYFACLEESDRQRFAPSEGDEATMSEFLSRAERAMTDLDREMAR